MDITNRTDIELLVNTFYHKVKQDDVIGHIFKQIIGDDWSAHLPVMYSFWETILLQQHGYNGNPVKKHIEIDKQVPLQPEHFKRWLELWNTTIDSLFQGPVADDAKHRANLMQNLINIKVHMARGGESLL